jgi:hypothetical protein
MNEALLQWRESDESDVRCWVRELDPNLYSTDHRRLCVWQDEFNGRWLWEIETFSGTGEAATGVETSLAAAQAAADGAARRSIKR